MFWGKLNNVKMVNAIIARVIHAVRRYPGYLVLKNENKIQIFIYWLSSVKICARKLATPCSIEVVPKLVPVLQAVLHPKF